VNINYLNNKLCIATSNIDKFNEMSAILGRLNLKLYDLKSLNINSHPDENGKTFEENALIKSQYYFRLSNMPVIADDSGFCIPALDNQPGIFSARFAEPDKNYSNAFKKIRLLLQQKGIEQHDGIDAHFICYLVLFFDKNTFIVTNGKITGKLNFNTIDVSGGFGYDPIFIPDGFNKTFAEMSLQEKNSISHRSIAIKKMMKKIKNND
jgi:XTP/dITP diphosphohydrolase